MADQEDSALDRTLVERIFHERARALAEPREADDAGETTVLVVLLLGGEQYGVDISYVREIRQLETLTPLPGTPAFWAGLVNVRGRLYPVLDLARYLALPDTVPVQAGFLVLVAAANLDVALLVDDKPEVRRLRQAELGPPLCEAAQLRRSIVKGITSDLLAVINVEVLLADPSLVVQAQ